MTYNEWRDELKANLLCVSDGERRRVLDYYAEAYADRRDAGFSEREIIDDFGAPYDAAQRILAENREEYGSYSSHGEKHDAYGANSRGCYREDRRAEREQAREERRAEKEKRRAERERYSEPRNGGRTRKTDCYDDGYYESGYNRSAHSPQPQQKQDGGYTFLFVLLCIVFCVPIFGVIIGMIGITIGFCAAPFGLLISSVAMIGSGIGEMFTNVASGAITLGTGIVLFGLSLIIMPLFFKLISLMWKLFTGLFRWLKNFLCGRRAY